MISVSFSHQVGHRLTLSVLGRGARSLLARFGKVVSFTTLAHVRLGWLGGLAVSRERKKRETHHKEGKSTWWDGREYQGEETFPETMEMFKSKCSAIDTPTMLVFDDSMILYSLPSQSLFQLLSRAVSNV